jgi:hypothetical protein
MFSSANSTSARVLEEGFRKLSSWRMKGTLWLEEKGMTNAWLKSESVADEKLAKDIEVRAPIETRRDMAVYNGYSAERTKLRRPQRHGKDGLSHTAVVQWFRKR